MRAVDTFPQKHIKTKVLKLDAMFPKMESCRPTDLVFRLIVMRTAGKKTCSRRMGRESFIIGEVPSFTTLFLSLPNLIRFDLLFCGGEKGNLGRSSKPEEEDGTFPIFLFRIKVGKTLFGAGKLRAGRDFLSHAPLLWRAKAPPLYTPNSQT